MTDGRVKLDFQAMLVLSMHTMMVYLRQKVAGFDNKKSGYLQSMQVVHSISDTTAERIVEPTVTKARIDEPAKIPSLTRAEKDRHTYHDRTMKMIGRTGLVNSSADFLLRRRKFRQTMKFPMT